MRGRAILARALLGLILAGLAFAGPASGGDAAFRVRPSDVGAGAPAGGMRRTIQPFGGWTLVCDEDLKARRKVCNVSQIIVDVAGQTAFSWSLAATKGGAPVMIVRAPNGPGDGRLLHLRFRKSATLIEIPLTACDAAQCLGYLTVAPEIGAKLRGGVPAEITLTREGRLRDIDAPTDGLAAALAALK